MKIIEGDFASLMLNNALIIQQVNCCGVMGAGVAKVLRDRFPIIYQCYQHDCIGKAPHTLFKRNGVHSLLVKLPESSTCHHSYCVCIFSQLYYGRDATRHYTDEHKLLQAMKFYSQYATKHHLSLVAPLDIGCGLANGNEFEIHEAMKKIPNLIAVDYVPHMENKIL